MSAPIVVRQGLASTITLYPPERLTRPATAATFRASTPAVKMPDATAAIACTRDEVSTVVLCEAKRGADVLEVVDTAGIVAGRRYLVKSQGAAQVVEAIESDFSTVRLDKPLLAAAHAEATLEGLAVFCPLTADQTADIGQGFAICIMQIAGEAVRVESTFRVEASVYQYALTAAELVTSAPEVRQMRDRTDETLASVIRTSWDRYVRPALAARKMIEDRIGTPRALNPAHIEACLLSLHRLARADLEVVRDQEQRFDRKLAEALVSADLWYRQDGTIEDPPAANDGVRPWTFTRLSR